MFVPLRRGPVAAALLLAAGTAGAAEEAAVAAPRDPESFPQAAEPSGPPAAPGLSPEELALLAESLGADAAAAPPAVAAAPPSGGFTNPDISAILDLVGAYHGGEPLPAGAHDPAVDGFNLQHLELAIGAAADPYFRFDGYLVFGPSSVEVEEAFATTLALPANLQLRAGQFLTRFGRINSTHPHSWQFVDTPLALGRYLGYHGASGLGVEGSWLAPLPWFAELIVSAHGTPTSGHGHDHGEEEHAHEDREAAEEVSHRPAAGIEDLGDFVYTVALKQFFLLHEDWGLLFGLSTEQGPDDGHGHRSSIYGADLHLRYRPVANTDRAAVALQLEGLYRDTEGHGDYGGYAQLVWSIDPEWETGVRYEWISGPEDEHRLLEHPETGSRRRAAAQLTYYPSHFSRIRVQVNRDEPSWARHSWAGFLQLEVCVGAHGAHSY